MFQGTFTHYESHNGKEKKVTREFTDAKKFDEFIKNYSFDPLFAIEKTDNSAKKVLPAKKAEPKKPAPKAPIKKAPAKPVAKKVPPVKKATPITKAPAKPVAKKAVPAKKPVAKKKK